MTSHVLALPVPASGVNVAAACERFALALRECYSEPFSVTASGLAALYVCNCNGLRQRDVAQAIEAGATRPKDIFASNQCAPQCAKCVCEMRQMIQDTQAAFALAAE